MTQEEWNRFMDGLYHPTCPEAPIPPDARQAMAEQSGK
jgi:hypothetical protein